MMVQRTNPNHKFKVGITATCSCGWKADGCWYGRGARAGAAADWRSHRERCEKAKEDV